MNIDGSNPRRLTNEVGYDGGAFYSQDRQWIVWRANRPKTAGRSENVQGSAGQRSGHAQQDGNHDHENRRYPEEATHFQWRRQFRSVLSSKRQADHFFVRHEQQAPGIPNFDLYLINRDGTGLQQITFDEGFDAFPMFNNDGKKLVWASSRHGAKEGDIDIFIADWTTERRIGDNPLRVRSRAKHELSRATPVVRLDHFATGARLAGEVILIAATVRSAGGITNERRSYQALKKRISGEVRFDETSRFSTAPTPVSMKSNRSAS